MEAIHQPKRGRPRKVAHDAIPAWEGEDAHSGACGDGAVSAGDVEAKSGPRSWAQLNATLTDLVCGIKPKTVVRVWVDFEAPEHWTGPYCGATVARGDWKVLLNTGEEISP